MATELQDLCKNHEFLSAYLAYSSTGETPQIYSLWSALTGVSATLSRKFYMPFGNDETYPNIYTLLIGHAGYRKTTAVNTLQKLLIQSTSVRFAPTDMSGQRQGLFNALCGDEFDDDPKTTKNMRNTREVMDEFDDFSFMDESSVDAAINPLDKSSLFACAGEFASFIGQKSAPLLTFLSELYDNVEVYDYHLKNSSVQIKQPTIQMLGAITPSQLFDNLPDGSMHSGFLSRMILIASTEERKLVPRPTRGDEKYKDIILRTFTHTYHNVSGALQERKPAADCLNDLYIKNAKNPAVTDSRFLSYNERRHAHLRKLLLLVVASSHRTEATVADVELADAILRYTEASMPAALGEFGLSKDSRLKQRIMDIVSSQPHKYITHAKLYNEVSNDCNMVLFASLINDLISTSKVSRIDSFFDVKSNLKTVIYCMPQYAAALSGEQQAIKLIKF